jgi:hypothetical protein
LPGPLGVNIIKLSLNFIEFAPRSDLKIIKHRQLNIVIIRRRKMGRRRRGIHGVARLAAAGALCVVGVSAEVQLSLRVGDKRKLFWE